MPHVKDHKHHSKKHQDHDEGEKPGSENDVNPAARAKRRPGREEPEASDAEVKVVDVETGATSEAAAWPETEESVEAKTHQKEASSNESSSASDESEDSDASKIEINFPGSELLRSKFPQPFDVAEKVATDWMNNGDFANLPIKQPLAQFAAQKGLQRAKEIEKKVLESPTTEKVAMQVLTVGFKAQTLFQQIRSRLKKD